MGQPLRWDTHFKEITAREGETKMQFSYAVTNISQGEVVLRGVSTSCSCAKASLEQTPLALAPGAGGQVRVEMDFTGKRGVLVKTVLVDTSVGLRVLNFKLTIPDPPASMTERERNPLLAKLDRQAVFKGDCAKCHAEPARGKTGKELYQAACGICHAGEHRASMVPDLTNPKPGTVRDAAYWRLWITHGKTNTFMPAFAASQGGPLTPSQVSLLVELLTSQDRGK